MFKLLLFFFFVSAVHAESVKVGMVDMQKVFNTVKEGVDVNAKLKKTFQDKQNVLKKDEDSLKKLRDDLTKQAEILSADARLKKEKELQEKFMTYQNKRNEFQNDIQKLEQEMKRPILEKVAKIIEEVSKNESVQMTFEATSTPLFYVAEKADLTEKVIKLYDEKHPNKK